MEVWLALSLLSAFFYALTNAIDKQIIGKYLHDHSTCLFLAACFDVLYAVPIAILTGFVFSFSSHSLAAMLAGILGASGGLAWYFSLKNEKASVVSAIFASHPLYTLLLAFVFLGESPTIVQVFGIIMLVSGSVAVSLQGTSRLSGMFLPAILGAFLWGASAVFVKYSLEGLGFWQSFVTRTMGIALTIIPLGLLLLLADGKKDILGEKPKKSLLLFAASEAVVMGGLALFILAASMGPISLVSAAGATAPLLTLLWIFLLKGKHIAVDELGGENVRRILLGTAMAAGGIYLIS